MGVICLVTFNPRVMVIKMSKMAKFLHFLLMTVCAKYLSAPEKHFRVLLENGVVNKALELPFVRYRG